jgi:hypothetical protein
MTEHDRKLRAALAAAARKPCWLCAARPAGGSFVFVPYHPLLWGGRPDAHRVFVVPLCAACWASTTPEEREHRIEQWLAVEGWAA